VKNRTPCKTHGTTNPCPSCRADHLAGDHAGEAHTDTCRACRSAARPATTPAPAARRAHAVLDVAALAAGDDTLTHPTEV
jgi:hypothetical protein